ncbi:unnamed protein product [Arabis nemorensis]|uniref:Uncharacterized protein n=1 Tax=Arabis nemorensis TaxID=586526 RepID=A0A565BTB2_9BRAS|nr:unnamed protein product [Arabis nemorensis]
MNKFSRLPRRNDVVKSSKPIYITLPSHSSHNPHFCKISKSFFLNLSTPPSCPKSRSSRNNPIGRYSTEVWLRVKGRRTEVKGAICQGSGGLDFIGDTKVRRSRGECETEVEELSVEERKEAERRRGEEAFSMEDPSRRRSGFGDKVKFRTEVKRNCGSDEVSEAFDVGFGRGAEASFATLGGLSSRLKRRDGD